MSASPPAPGRWVVCKYGGTSVASLATWTTGILARTPAGRWGKPGDLGGAVAFLLSADAAFVTGATLPVDGGYASV